MGSGSSGSGETVTPVGSIQEGGCRSLGCLQGGGRELQPVIPALSPSLPCKAVR